MRKHDMAAALLLAGAMLLAACGSPAQATQPAGSGTAAETAGETAGETAAEGTATETTAAAQTAGEETTAAAQTAAEETAAAEETTAVETGETGEYDPYHVAQDLAAAMAENQLAYAPEVKTLDSGVQVQRTPSDDGIFNTYVLKADERGCAACHDSLRDVLNGLPMGHMDIRFEGDVDVTVVHCISCHTYSPGYVPEYYKFGSLVHGLHKNEAFTAMGGDCLSCHDMNESTGEMKLWDVEKYNVLRGIVDLDAESYEGEFAFDQTTQTDPEHMFSLNWISGFTDYMVYDDYVNDLKEEDFPFEDWEIRVEGLVDNPYTITLGEMIETMPSQTRVLSMHCTLDPCTGGLISTCEVTGIPVSALLEKAGVQDGAIEVYTEPADGVCSYPTTLEWLAEHDGLLVYEINGERLKIYQGYPVQSWMPGMGAPNFAKQVSRLVVSDEPVEELYTYVGWVREEEGRFFNKPNASIFHTKDGQIIEAGRPYTFEGFADAYDDPITAVEFSMDGGETWKTFATTGAQVGTWVYWHFTFTPEEPGAYVLKVRAVTESGLVSETPSTIMVNAQ